jgi:hypothetical protein
MEGGDIMTKGQDFHESYFHWVGVAILLSIIVDPKIRFFRRFGDQEQIYATKGEWT